MVALPTAEQVRLLVEQGFVVIPSFFTEEELAPVRADYESRVHRKHVDGELFSTTPFEAAQMRGLRQRFEGLLQAVRQHSHIKADLLPPSLGGYITSRKVKYGLHVDFGADFWSQGTENCIKVWIPLTKPSRSHLGVTFARMDKFKARDPEVHSRFVGRGAVMVDEQEVAIYHGAKELKLPLHRPISEILETPEIGVGDLALFRSDTIHGSQRREPADANGERVAWAFPIKWSEKVIERADLYCNGVKRRHMTRMGMASQLASFWYYRSPKISYAQYSNFEARVLKKQLIPAALFGAAYLIEPIVDRLEMRRLRSAAASSDA
jgi:hypothetical protein